MFGTLVIQLPCNYTGGSIVVHHQDEKKEFNFGGSDALGNFYYVAFYADCLHEVKPVTDGYCLCLIYNLIWKGSPNDAPTPPDHQLVINKINSILKEWEKDTESPDSPEMMTSLLEHQYSSSSLSFDFLKGFDKVMVKALIAAINGLQFNLFLAKLSVTQTWTTDEPGDCIRIGWPWDSDSFSEWGTESSFDSYEEVDLIDGSVVAESLISVDGWKIIRNSIELDVEYIVPEVNLSSLEPNHVKHHVTGNEGATVDKLYHLAAFILLPSCNNDVFFRFNTCSKVLLVLNNSKALPQENREILCDLTKGIEKVLIPEELVILVEHLSIIGQTKLIDDLLTESLLSKRQLCDIALFIGSQVGWNVLSVSLQHRFRFHGIRDNIKQLFYIIAAQDTLDDDKKIVCSAIVKVIMEQLLDETDSTPSPASDTVFKFFKCLDTLEVTDRLPQLVTKLSTCSTRYPLLDTLVPAIIDLYNTLSHPDIQQCIKELTAHCISVVAESLSESASPPRVFYSMPISCSCTDCSTLSSFLINPNKDEHRFSLPREKRKHIQDQLKGCTAIKCITESTGRPYTLIVTKTSDCIRNLHQKAFNALTALQPSDDAPPPQKKLRINA